MLRSWKIGRFCGIELFVHWTFFLLPLYVFLMTASRGVPVALFFVAGVLLLFGCVVLHEFGHALTARRFGIPTRDITMYPIGGVARMERMSEKPWEEFWIAIAGPMVNVVIALLIPLALRGAAYHAETAHLLLRRNVLFYGLGGLVAPFGGIPLIDACLTYLGMVT